MGTFIHIEGVVEMMVRHRLDTCDRSVGTLSANGNLSGGDDEVMR
jgi:hypothetical protein